MKLSTYQQLAMRTAKPLPHQMALLHAAAGLSSDGGEVMDVIKAYCIYGKELAITGNEGLLLELGDVCWFAVYAMDCYNTPLVTGVPQTDVSRILLAGTTINPTNKHEVLMRLGLKLMMYTGQFASIIMYDPADIRRVKETLAFIWGCVDRIAATVELPMEDIMTANIAKLKKRYPEGYSDYAAIMRADKESATKVKHR